MDSSITKGIRISVQSVYEPQTSKPAVGKYAFSYHVEISNQGQQAVQLINRHWIIVDADNVRREVKGPGVIGKQPIIQPGEYHSYQSWSVLRTPMGKMLGNFGMINLALQEKFYVKIPEFKLIADFVFN